MQTYWVNFYFNPRVKGEFRGNEHPTKEMADEAARHELEIEPETRLVRTEEFGRAETKQ